jgi:hypothetical protein
MISPIAKKSIGIFGFNLRVRCKQARKQITPAQKRRKVSFSKNHSLFLYKTETEKGNVSFM